MGLNDGFNIKNTRKLLEFKVFMFFRGLIIREICFQLWIIVQLILLFQLKIQFLTAIVQKIRVIITFITGIFVGTSPGN
jgi:hypothetical protein